MAKNKMAATTTARPDAPASANGKRRAGGKKGKRRAEEEEDGDADAAIAAKTAQLRVDGNNMEEDEQEDDGDDRPMGEKAAELNRANGLATASDEDGEDDDADVRRPGAAAAAAAHGGGGEQHAGDIPAAGVSGRATADSVVMLLRQALRGDDALLIQKCLAVDDERTVRATVRALGPQEVASLLRLLAGRLQTVQPGNKSALTWLQQTLTQHAGYVASAPGACARRWRLRVYLRVPLQRLRAVCLVWERGA